MDISSGQQAGACAGETHLGDFEVFEELGRGGAGVVYRARHVRSAQEVALKVVTLAGDLPEDERTRMIRRFRRECAAGRRVAHPGVLPILAVGADGDRYFFAMPLLRGRTFEQRLSVPPPLSRRQILAIAIRVGEALTAVHIAGLVHRDVKAANIFLAADRRVLLIDLGIAKFVDNVTRLTGTDVLLGSPYAMAPEQLRGGAIDARTDLYALGILLYEALAGQPPFCGETVVAVLVAIQHAPVPPITLENCPPLLQRVYALLFRRVLAKEPTQRLPELPTLVAALRRLHGVERRLETAASSGLDAELTGALRDLSAQLRRR